MDSLDKLELCAANAVVRARDYWHIKASAVRNHIYESRALVNDVSGRKLLFTVAATADLHRDGGYRLPAMSRSVDSLYLTLEG
jgi:hypothetical protein